MSGNNIATALHTALADVAPIHSVRIGRRDDNASWSIDFAPEATPEQRAAAEAVLAAFDPFTVARDDCSSRVAAEAEACRTAITSAHPLQGDTYQLKAQLAVNAKRTLVDTADLEDTALEDAERTNAAISQARALLEYEADVRGVTVDALAAMIIAKRDLWSELGMKIEAVRVGAAAAIQTAPDQVALATIEAQVTAALGLVKQQAG